MEDDHLHIVRAKVHNLDNNENPISNFHWGITLFLDAFMGFCVIFLRDLRVDVNQLISHYHTWPLFTNSIALFLPAGRRYWYSPFRFFGSFAILNATIWLSWVQLDNLQMDGENVVEGPVFSFPIWRVISTASVMLHAGFMWYKFGPYSAEQFLAFVQYAVAYFQHSRHAVWMAHLICLCMTPFVLCGSETIYRFHFNFGYKDLDAPLISLQAANGVTVLLKIYCLSLIVFDFKKRAIGYVLAAIGLVGQYLLFKASLISMVSDAPLSYAHISFESVILIDAFCLIILWLLPNLQKGDAKLPELQEKTQEMNPLRRMSDDET